MKILELPFDEEKQCEIYNRSLYPHCKIYEDLEIIYDGNEYIVDKIFKVSEVGRKSTTNNRFIIFYFKSDIGDLSYKISVNTNNKFRDTINSHIDISGVKYKVKAIIEPITEDGKGHIYRIIRFSAITRNPESCK